MTTLPADRYKRADRALTMLLSERDRLAAQSAQEPTDVTLRYQHGAVGLAAETWRRRTQVLVDNAALYEIATDVVDRLWSWAKNAPQAGSRRGFTWAARLLEDEG